MDWKVIISPKAVSDLEDIVAFIARHNQDAAVRMGEQLLLVAESLARFPERGRIVPEFKRLDWREVIYRSYRIIYRVDLVHKRIEVSRFWHGARGFPIVSRI